MENRNLTDAFRKQLEGLEPKPTTGHHPPPQRYEHNHHIFMGGDPIAWLDVYSSDPGLSLALVLPSYDNHVHLAAKHCQGQGGGIRPLRGVLNYPSGTTVHLFSVDFIERLRGARFHYCWVPHGLDDDTMGYVSMSVRLPVPE